MDGKIRRIFIATALGTMAGLYTAISFMPELIWWFGAIIGGFVAGFIYAFPDVILYSPAAFRIARKELKTTGKIIFVLGKSPIIIYRYAISMTIVQKLSALLYAIGIATFLSWALLTFSSPPNIQLSVFAFGVLPLLYCTVIISSASCWKYENDTERQQIKRLKKAIFLVTPPGYLYVLFYLIKWLMSLLASKLFIVLTESLRFLITFFRTLFFFVHSKELVLCAIDAAAGVLIAHPLLITAGNLQEGPAIVFGGLIGGLLGILHYEIISVRILHTAR